MTKEVLTFRTREEAKTEITRRNGIWRPLHHDLIDNKWRITFVDGIDDPDKTPEAEQKRLEEKTKQDRLAELKQKISDGTILATELIEYIRLRDIDTL